MKIMHFLHFYILMFAFLIPSMLFARTGTLTPIHDTINNNSTLDYIIFDPTKFRLKVVVPEQYKSYFISDFQAKTKAMLILTGGYLSEFSPPRPLGFVRSRGRTLSPSISTWLGGGVFCTDGKKILVQKFDQQIANTYPDCIQSGPLIIENGALRYKAGMPLQAGEEKLVRSVQEQTFLCNDSRGRVALGVSSPIKMDELASYLKEKLGCVNAIRFSGQETAGMIVKNHLYGNESLPLYSVVAVFVD